MTPASVPAPDLAKESVQRLGEIITLLNPNSGLREEATRLLSEVEAAFETSARERDQARQAYGKAMGRAEVADGSLEAARDALTLWNDSFPPHRYDCLVLTAHGCTCGVQQAREATRRALQTAIDKVGVA